jgi:hypothetical protein
VPLAIANDANAVDVADVVCRGDTSDLRHSSIEFVQNCSHAAHPPFKETQESRTRITHAYFYVKQGVCLQGGFDGDVDTRSPLLAFSGRLLALSPSVRSSPCIL